MWAAASGKGTTGIPKSVGKEFAAADPGGKLPEHSKKDIRMSKLDEAVGMMDSLTKRMDSLETKADGWSPEASNV